MKGNFICCSNILSDKDVIFIISILIISGLYLCPERKKSCPQSRKFLIRERRKMHIPKKQRSMPGKNEELVPRMEISRREKCHACGRLLHAEKEMSRLRNETSRREKCHACGRKNRQDSLLEDPCGKRPCHRDFQRFYRQFDL